MQPCKCNTPAFPYRLYDMAKDTVREEPPTIHPAIEGLKIYPYLRQSNAKTAAYVDVFVEKFLGLSQGPAHRQRQVR